MVQRSRDWLFAICCVLLATGPAWAADPGLQAEIEVLKERLAKLEAKVSEGEGRIVPPTGGEPATTIALPSGLHGVQISGFADTSYTYNLNEPNNRINTLRVFDTQAGSFMLNNAELVVEKPVSTESPTGFRTDIDWGTDMEVVGGVTTGLGDNAHTHGTSVAATDEVELQQAYFEYLAPIGNGLDIRAGKFVTMHGAEVIEAKDNWNFSRSYMFGYSIPFTHTGIRATYPWSDAFSTTVGINNGWDVVDDNNKAKTIELSATVTPMENASLGATYMVGAEQTGDSHDQRHLLDLVASYQPTEQLTLKLNVDIAREEDALSETGGGNATWNGLAAYAKYDVTDQWSLAGRWEIFNDNDGARTAVNAASTSPTGSPITDVQFMEWTLTNEYKLNSHLLARLEYRLDKADSKLFRHDQGFENYQNTLAVEFIAPF